MPEVAGQAIRNIDRRRGDAAQRRAQRDPRRRHFQSRAARGQRVGGERRAPGQRGERERGIAELPRYPDVVTGRGTCSRQRVPRRDLADDRDAQIERSARRVAADEIDAMRIGKREKSARERGQPAGVAVGQRPGQQRPPGRRAHRRDVGEVHGQRLVPERLGIDVGQEVPARDQHVHRHRQLLPRRRHEERRIVADAKRDGRRSRRTREETRDQLEFVHGGIIDDRRPPRGAPCQRSASPISLCHRASSRFFSAGAPNFAASMSITGALA